MRQFHNMHYCSDQCVCVLYSSPDEEWPNDDNENITNGINESATAEPTE